MRLLVLLMTAHIKKAPCPKDREHIVKSTLTISFLGRRFQLMHFCTYCLRQFIRHNYITFSMYVSTVFYLTFLFDFYLTFAPYMEPPLILLNGQLLYVNIVYINISTHVYPLHQFIHTVRISLNLHQHASIVHITHPACKSKHLCTMDSPVPEAYALHVPFLTSSSTTFENTTVLPVPVGSTSNLCLK